MAGLVMPECEAQGGLHGREDMHQPRILATLGQDILEAGLFSEASWRRTNSISRPASAGRLLGMGAQLIPERLGAMRIVAQEDVALGEIASQRAGMADLEQGAGDDNPAKAGERTGNLLLCRCANGLMTGSIQLENHTSTNMPRRVPPHTMARSLYAARQRLLDPCLVPATRGWDVIIG